MSSGQPDWGKLAELGRLPDNQKDKVPHLQQTQQFEQKVVTLEKTLELAVSFLTPKAKERYEAALQGKEIENDGQE